MIRVNSVLRGQSIGQNRHCNVHHRQCFEMPVHSFPERIARKEGSRSVRWDTCNEKIFVLSRSICLYLFSYF